jgi:hypothetical protein
MSLKPIDIDLTDRQALREEERARIGERIQVWTILLSMASIFGALALQSGAIAYLVGLYPLLVLCMSLHVNNSEQTLKMIRKYLYRQEQDAGHKAYEHFSRDPANARKSHGGYKTALRLAFSSTQFLAAASFVIRLQQSDPLTILRGVVDIELATILWPFIVRGVAGIEVAMILWSWYLLTDWKRGRKKSPQAGASQQEDEQGRQVGREASA